MRRQLSWCPHSASDWKPTSFPNHLPDSSLTLPNFPGYYLIFCTGPSWSFYYLGHYKNRDWLINLDRMNIKVHSYVQLIKSSSSSSPSSSISTKHSVVVTVCQNSSSICSFSLAWCDIHILADLLDLVVLCCHVIISIRSICGHAANEGVKKVKVYTVQPYMELHFRATGRHLPYGITQCYLPPDKWTHPALTPARPAGTWFTYPRGMEGWADQGGWLHTERVYLHTDGNPSKY